MIENLLSEVIVVGLQFPIVCSIVAANRSAVVVEYSATPTKIDVLMICGHVQSGGYQLPVLALFADRTQQAVLALIDAGGGTRLLYRPETQD